MQNLIDTLFLTYPYRLWLVFYPSSLFFIFEVFWPNEKQSIISRVRAAYFWATYLLITVFALELLRNIWSSIGFKSLLSINASFISNIPIVGGVIAVILGMIIWEFFYYWFHRLQHKSKVLWRFHKVHHSLQEMNAWNSNHHFTEEIFRMFFIVIPMSFFSIDFGVGSMVMVFILSLQGQYQHSNTKLSLGFIRYLIPDNRFHRIHHSLEVIHLNKNFGATTSIWDQVFGTAYFPIKKEWPAVGVFGTDEPNTLRGFLFMPFKK